MYSLRVIVCSFTNFCLALSSPLARVDKSIFSSFTLSLKFDSPAFHSSVCTQSPDKANLAPNSQFDQSTQILVGAHFSFHDLIRISKFKPVLQARKIPISLLIYRVTLQKIIFLPTLLHTQVLSNPYYDNPLQDATFIEC